VSAYRRCAQCRRWTDVIEMDEFITLDVHRWLCNRCSGDTRLVADMLAMADERQVGEPDEEPEPAHYAAVNWAGVAKIDPTARGPRCL